MSRGPCFLAKPIVTALRHSKLERYWKELEDPNEAPLRKIIEQDTLAKDALASLEQSVLTPHKWTFTRYTVQVLRALRVQDLKQATALLRQEAYLRSTLRYVAWDGPPAFDTINSARVETIELFNFLEDTRTGGGPDAEQMQKTLDMFFAASIGADPYSVGGQWCNEPDDAGTPEEPPAPNKKEMT